MNHSQLRAFHAVAIQGGFTKAAAALRVTQPTLSGQVKALEESYGVKLFERRGRSIEITGLGRALLEITRRHFHLETEAEQLMSAARGLLHGHLRLGADSPYNVIPLLAAFGRRYPAIQRSISFGNTQRLLRGLQDHDSDVAVLPEVSSGSELVAVPFKRDRLVAFVDRGHAWSRRRSIRLRDLEHQAMVLREPGSTTRAIFDRALVRAKITLGEVMEIGSREGVREAVAAGLGIGVVSEGEFGHDDRLRQLPVRDFKLQVTEYVVCLRERSETPVVKAFFDLVDELAQV